VFAQLAAPAVLYAPYALVAVGGGVFRWTWLTVYALLSMALAVLPWLGKRRGNGWCELSALAVLRPIVDLCFFESA